MRSQPWLARISPVYNRVAIKQVINKLSGVRSIVERPYTIWNPGYYHMSGGIRAIYQLKQDLLMRGLNVNFHNERRYEEEIMIYPEIVSGNPENAGRYIKWLLNKAEFPNEVCFAWETGMGDYPLLTTNIVEMNLWVPSRSKTNTVAYWIGKGVFDPSVLPPGAVEISRNNFFNRRDLAHFISTLDYMISFDPFTAINIESVVAGTPVLIHTSNMQQNPFTMVMESEHAWSREHIENQGWMPYGLAWNYEELDKARQEVHLARPHYQNMIKVFNKRIDNFILSTQEMFS